jgi:hypothetical protein
VHVRMCGRVRRGIDKCMRSKECDQGEGRERTRWQLCEHVKIDAESMTLNFPVDC